MNAEVAIQWRALTVEDGAEWARLLLSVEESYGTEDFVGAEDLVEDLRDPDVDPERGTIAAFSEGSMIAYAGLRPSPTVTDRHEIDLYGAVHPSRRGRGLGSRLLAWAERAALPLHQARYPGHPPPGVLHRHRRRDQGGPRARHRLCAARPLTRRRPRGRLRHRHFVRGHRLPDWRADSLRAHGLHQAEDVSHPHQGPDGSVTG